MTHMKNPYHPNLPDGFSELWMSVAELPNRPAMSENYEQGLKEFKAILVKMTDDAAMVWSGYMLSELHRNWIDGMFEAVQLWQTSERAAAKKIKSFYGF